MTSVGRTPSEAELADARRSGRLAGREGFPAGVCPYDPRRPDEDALARVWVAAYTDARQDDTAPGRDGGA
ncbi:ribosome modulation factor [Nonomuraea glycinis]|uniref:ribosome modulation factor n=1 Tax=Nonomuraea glycinis TaxID=2047744 RepID=UPI0033BB6D32